MTGVQTCALPISGAAEADDFAPDLGDDHVAAGALRREAPMPVVGTLLDVEAVEVAVGKQAAIRRLPALDMDQRDAGRILRRGVADRDAHDIFSITATKKPSVPCAAGERRSDGSLVGADPPTVPGQISPTGIWRYPGWRSRKSETWS